MSKMTFRKDYKKYYDDVIDYSVAVHRKFASHNMFLFFIYGLGLSIIDIENKTLSCGMCFAISAISFIIFGISKCNLMNNRKGLRMIIYNVYLFLFLLFITLFYYWHPSNVGYTVLLCSIITTAMTNMVPLHYISILLTVFIFDNILHFVFGEVGDTIAIVGYVLNDFLIFIFSVGINVLFSDMKIKEFKQNRFLQNESYHDPLTKIYNRRYVERYVELNFDGADQWAMFLMDVDNFKQVNDNLGHEYGDELLCRISDILRNNFRKTDCVARIGGDEFLVLMPRIQDMSIVAEKAKRILENFPIEIEDNKGDQTIPVSVSIGIAFTKFGEETTYEEMYRRSDGYMYQAKNKGKGVAVMEDINGKRERVIIG